MGVAAICANSHHAALVNSVTTAQRGVKVSRVSRRQPTATHRSTASRELRLRCGRERGTETSQWMDHGERVVDDTRRTVLSVADVELPDGVRFEQCVRDHHRRRVDFRTLGRAVAQGDWAALGNGFDDRHPRSTFGAGQVVGGAVAGGGRRRAGRIGVEVQCRQ